MPRQRKLGPDAKDRKRQAAVRRLEAAKSSLAKAQASADKAVAAHRVKGHLSTQKRAMAAMRRVGKAGDMVARRRRELDKLERRLF